MTKVQLFERIKQSTEIYMNNIKDMTKCMGDMQDYDNVMLVNAISVSGGGIADALNNIALVLCEMLPKEE